MFDEDADLRALLSILDPKARDTLRRSRSATRPTGIRSLRTCFVTATDEATTGLT
jgi:hypothetical protein